MKNCASENNFLRGIRITLEDIHVLVYALLILSKSNEGCFWKAQNSIIPNIQCYRTI